MKKLMFALMCLGLSAAVACDKKAGDDKPADSKPAATKTADTKTPAAAGGDKSTIGDHAKGKATYEKICSACHGATGNGNGGVTAPDFGKDKRLAKTNVELLKSITEGTTGKIGSMPAQKDALSEQEIKDVLSYMHKTFGG